MESNATYWHPAFYADIQIELEDDADNLIFENEHQLGKEPMEIDVLIIKKNTDRPVKKNIGRIFRKHNILEYKSPNDSLSIDDFYKVYGYACFYKADVPYVNSISVEDLTISFVSEKFPRKLVWHLRTVKNYQVTLKEPGIYHVEGDIIPIQIIVTRQLSDKENLWLRSLTNNLTETRHAKRLMEDYLGHTDNNLYQSVLDIIVRANHRTFEEVNGMGDIFMEIVQEKFDKKLKEETEKNVNRIIGEISKKAEAIAEARAEARAEAMAEARAEAIAEARAEAIVKERSQAARLTERISLIQKKYAKQKPLSMIADELETVPEEVLPIYNAISEDPDKTAEEIYQFVFCR